MSAVQINDSLRLTTSAEPSVGDAPPRDQPHVEVYSFNIGETNGPHLTTFKAVVPTVESVRDALDEHRAGLAAALQPLLAKFGVNAAGYQTIEVARWPEDTWIVRYHCAITGSDSVMKSYAGPSLDSLGES